MQLRDYLAHNDLTLSAFAAKIGAANAGTVAKYCDGSRIPRRSFMQAIVLATDGQVQPSDFFPPPPILVGDQSAEVA